MEYLNQIICGDCLEVMQDLPLEKIAAVIADPPYGMNYKTHHNDNPTSSQVMAACAPPEKFLEGHLQMLGVCHGIVLLPGWEESEGTWGDLERAMLRRLQVFHWPVDKAAIAEWGRG